MRYTLWSGGRLVGHTDLDIHTVSTGMRQGFVEPTEEGRQLLADATGVWRTMAEVKRASRARGGQGENDLDLFGAAVDRREALELELRDEQGVRFDCRFIQITDLFDMESGIVDELCDTEEELEADFEIRLSALSAGERERALAERARSDAELDEVVMEMLEYRNELEVLDPEPAQDPRWETMQYLLQAYLAVPAWEKGEFDCD